MSEDIFKIEEFIIPKDEYWSSVDEIPDNLRRVIDIYSMALRDDVEADVVEVEDIDEVYEVYDSFKDQECRIAKVGEQVVGVVSFDFKGRKMPFVDGIAVDPNFRGVELRLF